MQGAIALRGINALRTRNTSATCARQVHGASDPVLPFAHFRIFDRLECNLERATRCIFAASSCRSVRWACMNPRCSTRPIVRFACVRGLAMHRLPNGWEQVRDSSANYVRCVDR